jgi:hypothetical protein
MAEAEALPAVVKVPPTNLSFGGGVG